ncbi:hypothetical protein [Ruegeria arenilitoris]|uniref:hypothetical protein n=1 Tax=Ruegeria arenilitoris TaxID=1173585 RepID=UPI00147B754C|nr:hypothetical protein [Ruegeria arenilitoris]
MGTVEEAFDAHRSQIKELREKDETFRQICCDYECLSTLLSGHHAEQQLKHVLSSLTGLEEEIRSYLIAQKSRGHEPK